MAGIVLLAAFAPPMAGLALRYGARRGPSARCSRGLAAAALIGCSTPLRALATALPRRRSGDPLRPARLRADAAARRAGAADARTRPLGPHARSVASGTPGMLALPHEEEQPGERSLESSVAMQISGASNARRADPIGSPTGPPCRSRRGSRPQVRCDAMGWSGVSVIPSSGRARPAPSPSRTSRMDLADRHGPAAPSRRRRATRRPSPLGGAAAAPLTKRRSRDADEALPLQPRGHALDDRRPRHPARARAPSHRPGAVREFKGVMERGAAPRGWRGFPFDRRDQAALASPGVAAATCRPCATRGRTQAPPRGERA